MTYQATIQADNPVAYYRLDESSGTTAADLSPLRVSGATVADSSGHSHGATYGNSGDGIMPGYVGQGPTPDGACMQFDGAFGYVSAATTGLPTGNSAWTMECWVYPTLNAANQNVMGFGAAGNTNQCPRLFWTGTQFTIDPWGGAVCATAGTINAWNYVVVTWDGSTLKLSVNAGTQTTNAHAALNVTLGSAGVGARPGASTTDSFTGYVAEASWYSAALTTTQISAHYSARNNTGGSSFANTVLGDSPVSYYRLNDKGPLDTGTYSATGVTYSATGLLTGDTDTAVTLNGSSGFIYSARKFKNPNPVSLECWFKTSMSTGGNLLGFEDAQSVGTGSRDRIVWMDTAGKLHFQTIPSGSAVDIISTSAYNDGNTHHVVATLGPTGGMILYVDGASVASNGTQKTGQTNYNAYHLSGGVGASTAANGGSETSDYLNGTLDEVAVYAYELTSAQVTAHYTAGSTAPVSGSATAIANASVGVQAAVGPAAINAVANATFSVTGGTTTPTGAATYTLLLGGAAVNLIAGSLDLTNQIGQRSQGRASVWTGTGIVYDYGTSVSVVDDKGTTIYTGFVLEDQVTLAGLAPKILQHDLTIADNHYLADKRLAHDSFLNTVAGVIVKSMWQAYLAAEGVTIGAIADGVWLPEFVANYEPVSAQFDKLAAMCGFWWEIDEKRRLFFQPYGAKPGPYTIDGTTIDQTQQFSCTIGNKDYRNRQYGVGGRDHTSVLTENFVGDGKRRQWTLRYPVASLQGHDPKSGLTKGIYLNGVLQTNVAPKSAGQNTEWGYAISDAVVAQWDTYPVLTSGDNLQIIYAGEYPVVALAQNKAEVAAQRLKEGVGTGYVEARYANLKVHTLDAMFAIAQAQLGYYSQTMTTLVFTTRTGGITQGQTLKVNLPDFTLNNRAMLVESVEITDSIDAANIWYVVTCVGSPYSVAQWQTFWQHLLNQDNAADINADNQSESASIAEVAQSQAIWQWSGHTTATKQSCLICGPSTLCGPAQLVC